MPNKNSNVAYDQIPHLVINHPETNPEHWAIMLKIFKILKDVSYPIIYSNQQLAIDCRMSLRNVERRVSELKKMGLIQSSGHGYSRRISLGLLFNNPAIMADKNLTTPPKVGVSTAKSDPLNRHYGGDYKITSKNTYKGNFSSTSTSTPKTQTPSVTDFQEFKAGIKGYEWVGEWIAKEEAKNERKD